MTDDPGIEPPAPADHSVSNLMIITAIILSAIIWSAYFLINRSFASVKFDLFYGCFTGLVTGLILGGILGLIARTLGRSREDAPWSGGE